MSAAFSAVAGWAVGHARIVLAIAVLVALMAGVGATQLPTNAGTDTLVDRGSESYRATERVREVFGEEPVVVVAEGDLQELILTPNLGRLLRLEGCLSGKVPKGARPIPGPCTELAELDPVQYLAGPGTFLNEAVIQIDEQLTRLAKTVPPDRLREFLLQVAARYGITSAPSLGNPNFLASVVFDLNRGRGIPKPKLAYLFPNDHSTQIVLRLKPDLTDAERSRALELIREAVYDTTPRKACEYKGKAEACFGLHGKGTYTISGAPVVIEGITGALKRALLNLLAVAIVVMALALLLIFRSRFRLLPLGIALAAAAIVFGLLELFGGSLTIASIAVLPILIGLVVDYSIQLQARFDEAAGGGVAPRRSRASRCRACRADHRHRVLGDGSRLSRASAFADTHGPWVRLVARARDRGRVWAGADGGIRGAWPATEGWSRGSPGCARRPVLRPAHSEKAGNAAAKNPASGGGPPTPTRASLGIGAAGIRSGCWRRGGAGRRGVGAWDTDRNCQSDIRSLGPAGLREIKDLNRVQDATGVSGRAAGGGGSSRHGRSGGDPVDGGVQAARVECERVFGAEAELPEG